MSELLSLLRIYIRFSDTPGSDEGLRRMEELYVFIRNSDDNWLLINEMYSFNVYVNRTVTESDVIDEIGCRMLGNV